MQAGEVSKLLLGHASFQPDLANRLPEEPKDF
jgi:hypothetical protein